MALRNELAKQGNFLFKYRSYLPLVILLVALYVYVQHEINTFDADSIQKQWYELGCLAVALIGVIIRAITIGYSADQTSGRNTTEGQIAESVNTTGPYSQLRHPLYLGNFFMWLGLAMFTQNLWFIIAFTFIYWVYYERIMYAEEEFLIGKFKDEYLKFSEKTPAFIPAFKNWKKPKYTFSMLKVIRQEKAGIVNLFAVILLFRVVATYVAYGSVDPEKHWIYAFALSVIWYVVIKVLQKTTRIFNTGR